MNILFKKDGKPITEDLDLINGKALPSGWSQYEVTYKGEHIGWLESGYPMDLTEGWTFEEVENKKRERAMTMLLDELHEALGDWNYQIYFDGQWGLVEDGSFVECGTWEDVQVRIGQLIEEDKEYGS